MDIISKYFSEYGIESFLLIYLVLIIVFFIFLFLLNSLIIFFRDPSILAYKTSNGDVEVSKNAVKDLILSVCNNENGIIKANAIIKNYKDLNLKIKIQINNKSNLRIIEENLQKKIRETLIENLGIEKVGRINIIAVGIKLKNELSDNPE